MRDAHTCPDCGSPVPARSPEGLCPRCLLLGGMAGHTSVPLKATLGFEGSGSVLATIAETVGALPQVLLRDTDAGFEAPLVRASREAGAVGPGRYRIDGEIARGGMGAVLQARDPDLGREVAIKVLRDDLRGNADLVRRFIEEAQIGGQLQHPGIVPVYELGTFPDLRPYFAMKLVKGRTLAALLDARGKPSDDHARFLGVFEQVAQTVAYAHARGVIHRDLKPSNVMVGAFGEVQVMDWGLAKVLTEGGVADDERSQATRNEVGVVRTVRSGSAVDASQAGSVLGTPAYMAPEQASGDVEMVDERADVFGLGSILCEVLTGRPAYTGKSGHEVLGKAARGETADALARLASSRADPDLRALATDCLAVEPVDRPRDAGVVASRLTAHLGKVQEKLRSSELARADAQARAEESQHTAVAAQARAKAERSARRLTLALAVSVFAVASIATFAANQYRLIARQEERLRSEAVELANVEVRAKNELEASLYFHRIALAHRELSADNLARTRELLDECPPSLRGWEWDYLNRLCRVEPITLRGCEKGVYSLAFSPDGRRLASANGDGTIEVFDSKSSGGAKLTLRGHSDFVFSVAFSPDGKNLASASADRTVKVWDLMTGEVTLNRAGHEGVLTGAAYGVTFSPDGGCLAYGVDGDVILWDLTAGRTLFHLPGHERFATSVAFSPDGRSLVSGSFKGLVRVWDALNGRLIRTITAHDDPITCVLFRPDGLRLATASFDRLVKIWDVTTGQPVRTMTGHTGLVLGLAFSHDGRRLASCGEDKTVKLWDAGTGQEVLNLRGHSALCECLAFSPDGHRFATAGHDATIRIWDATHLKRGEGLESLTLTHDHEVWSVAFSPNGRRIMSSSWDKTVRHWDATSGELLHTIADRGRVFRAEFSPPDGKYLASISASAASAGRGAVVKVRDAATYEEVLSTIPENYSPFCVAFSPDGQYFLKEGPNHAIRVLDARTGGEMGILGRHAQDIWCYKFSPDGRLLASASNDFTVKLWDATRLWPEQKRPLTIPLRVGGFGDRLAFSPDSRRLVTGGEEHTVKVWDAGTGKEIKTLRGHSGDVYCVAASRDGRWLASAGEDTTVRLWDATSGELLHTLRGHTGLISSLAFSPDGHRLVSGSRDRTVKVWDLVKLR
jgi:WD40 repeat protein/serine/threonine protein kinase